MSLPLIIKDIEKRVLRSGDILSGDLFINKDISTLSLNIPNSQASSWIVKNANSEQDYGVFLFDKDKEGKQSILRLCAASQEAQILKLPSSSGDLQYFTVLDSGNFNNYALPLTGGIISGTSIGFFNGASQIWSDTNTINIFSRNIQNDDSNGRYLGVYNSNTTNLADSLIFRDVVNSNQTTYKIYGEHNKPTAKDVEALAWCSNEDVNTSPSILAVVNSMNTGGSFFAVQNSTIINATDSPFPGAEFHYFVLMDTQQRKRVIAHHYNDGGFNIFTRRVFNGSWLDEAWVNLGQAFSNADTVDGYHGWEFPRTAYTTTNDLNYLTFSGMYRLNGGSGVNINAPSGVDWGQVLVVRGGGDTIAQVGFDYGESRAWLRTGNPPECNGTGAWRPWHQFYTSGNITKGTGSAPALTENYIYLQYT